MMIWEKGGIGIKARSRQLGYRAFSAYVLRVLCGLGYKEICGNIYNMTISGCARLCNRGYELVKNEERYLSLFEGLISA
ncbi:hypothetical protein DFR58_111113 [Anaerobacterium chartisolvens]|uniref:Uncharacterized protein n=1 Tax=Anaerobacterium chartisolvens TaxID=1297424 RepID=A0A369B6X8_9FIRM|nr:hypothetical protein [Anaerobacterium chartisolvens]RCX16368.1 hypothetical protein DFR58_111113 [Anaerobacterium chartisolvens]